MTSYRIAAVAAVSSASACLSTLVYLSSPVGESAMAGRDADDAVSSLPEEARVAIEVESPDRRRGPGDGESW